MDQHAQPSCATAAGSMAAARTGVNVTLRGNQVVQLSWPSASEAPTVRFLAPASLRAALRGRWLYFHGDSSMRGLVLSLYQQLHVGPTAGPAGRVETASWLGRRDMPTGKIGFLDAVIDVATGALLGIRTNKLAPDSKRTSCSAPPSSGSCITHPFRAPNKDGYFGPRPRRESLAALWCLGTDASAPLSATASACERGLQNDTSRWRRCGSTAGRVRITYRSGSLLSGLATDPFEELRRCWALASKAASAHALSEAGKGPHVTSAAASQPPSPWLTSAPDAHVIQLGNWDESTLPTRREYEYKVHLGVAAWRRAAAAAQAALIYASSPAPTRLLADDAPTHCSRVRNRLPPECVQTDVTSRGRREAFHGGAYEEALFLSMVAHGRCRHDDSNNRTAAVEPVATLAKAPRRPLLQDERPGSALAGADNGPLPAVRLLNRVSSGGMLEAAVGTHCACLDSVWRESKGGQSARYHPPHLHNLLDVQRLASLIVGSPSTRRGAGSDRKRARGHEGMARAPAGVESVRLTLEQSVGSGCCCDAPEDVDGMWAQVCRVSEG